MFTKKAVIPLTLMFILVLVGSAIMMHHYNQKQQTTKIEDAFISENHYKKDIQNKKIKYDSINGDYFEEIIFKDEPEHLYEVYVDPKNKKVDFLIAFGKDRVEITDARKAKYLKP